MPDIEQGDCECDVFPSWQQQSRQRSWWPASLRRRPISQVSGRSFPIPTQRLAAVAVVYKLDGSESKNAGRGGEVVSKATWEGNKVSITTQQPGRDGGAPTPVTMKIGVTGGQMEVETDAGRGPNKQTYKKG
jgi:hypothetical protein